MRRLVSTTFAATLAIATTATAQPSTSPPEADARCLLAMVALSNTSDPNQQRMGESGVSYFTGRIAGRDPNFDFASLKALAAKMDMQAAQNELQQRCGPMFNRSMQQVGAALAPPPSAGAAPPAQPAPRQP